MNVFKKSAAARSYKTMGDVAVATADFKAAVDCYAEATRLFNEVAAFWWGLCAFASGIATGISIEVVLHASLGHS